MRSALILLRSAEAGGANLISEAENVLACGGIRPDTTEALTVGDDITFRRRLEEFKDTADALIIIGGDKAAFDLKSIIAESTDSVLVENENARIYLDAVKNADNKDYPDSYAVLPMEATVVPNIRGAYQGFILDDKEFTLAVLPQACAEYKSMCDKYVLPYLNNKFGIKSKRITLKFFGDAKVLADTLTEAKNNFGDAFGFEYGGKYGDFSVNLLFPEADAPETGETVRFIVSKLKENVYAEFDTTLGERLFDLLKLKKLKLSCAESFTGGRVISSVIVCPGASEFVHEGIVAYSNDSKYFRLGVSGTDLKRDGAASSVVAYEMAAGLISTGKCDVAIATTGIAGPQSDDSGKPVGLCYIAVGMKDGVHTYKFNFGGTREEITETAKNTALFLAIRKLKNL